MVGPPPGENPEGRAHRGAAQHRRQAGDQVLAARQQTRDLPRYARRLRLMLDVVHDLGEAEDAHGDRHEAEPVEQDVDPHGEAIGTALDVGADQPEQNAEHDHRDRLEHRAVRQHDRRNQTQQHDRDVVGRVEQERDRGERRAGRGDQDGDDRPGEQGGDRRHGERRPGAALLRHLVPVEHGDHRGGLARDLHQDGGGRAAVLGAVEHARQHDHGADRPKPERERHEHRHGGERADPGQHTDHRADEAADEADDDVLQRQRDAEAHRDVGEEAAEPCNRVGERAHLTAPGATAGSAS